MAKKRKSTYKRLKTQLEVTKISARSTDAVDSEVGTYVSAFLEGLPEAVKLEKFSLATPEEAKSALVVIEQTLVRLNRQLANARALQRLVSEARNR